MRILYCAIDQTVPGTKGGSTHVQSVAEGLAARGHEVHVAVRPGVSGFPRTQGDDDGDAGDLRKRGDHSDGDPRDSKAGPQERDDRGSQRAGVRWHALGAPFDRAQLRLLRAGAVRRLAEAIRPEVVIERYHNFGGEGLLAARRTGARAVLEVNAPVIDYPGSPKQRLDRLLLVQPFRRWREWQCRVADRIVTPTRTILPAWVPAGRVHETEWGADTERFRPGTTGPVPFSRDGRIVLIFVGAFRAWHGVHHFVRAMRHLHEQGRTEFHAVLIGDGPERAPAEAQASGLTSVTFTGALPHDALPACLAAADVGVAPFDVSAHAPLSLTFYWSPLKVFEYMASGLPVVAPDLPRLRQILSGHGTGNAGPGPAPATAAGDAARESVPVPSTEIPGTGEAGLLYDAADPRALAGAIVTLADPARRRAMGTAARARAVREYSWASHCEQLEEALRAE